MAYKQKIKSFKKGYKKGYEEGKREGRMIFYGLAKEIHDKGLFKTLRKAGVI